MSIRFQKALGRALIITGALAFSCWGELVVKEFRIQGAARRMLESTHEYLASRHNDGHGNRQAVPKMGDVIGQLEIPRIHISVMVLEGSRPSILDVAAGHIEGTALPGEVGNVAIAAHRDTFFHPLQQIRTNDIIDLATANGNFQYVVQGMEVVEPSDIQVLQQTRDAQLTLVTCYPFYYIGAAPKRFIVHARRSS
jgi:LPXTG-site transpeptidase (sortase) family protein